MLDLVSREFMKFSITLILNERALKSKIGQHKCFMFIRNIQVVSMTLENQLMQMKVLITGESTQIIPMGLN